MANKSSKSSDRRVSTAEARRSLQADIESFLAAGNKIEQIPSGVSGQAPLGQRKHPLRGDARKRT